MKIKAGVIVFDMDDTLAQTSIYIRDLLFARWKLEKRDDLVEVYNRHTAHEGQISITQPEIRQHIYEILSDPTFMLKVEPTRLFDRIFKTKGMYKLIKNKRVVITTHRGFHDVGKEYTEQWLKDHKADKYIETVHCLNSTENPDKIQFLKKIYGDDFILIDDNPLHDLTKEYWEDPRILIYNEYGDYPAYRNQNFLIF